MPEAFSFASFEVGHVIARKHGGPTTDDNLAYACSLCNRFKGSDLATIIPGSGVKAPLFNPRSDNSNQRFAWDGGLITPKTDVGRATAALLRLDDPMRIEERRILDTVFAARPDGN